jgi:acetyl-CoA carboxylase biotin carboxylase subunit
MMSFSKILVANRGEIAIRIMRACREMDIESVAVYSEIDRTAKHVRYADEAFCIGPAPSIESYLRINRIIETALASGCDAIHPGYGFLAENPELPAACKDAGIVFIGPSSESMSLLGNKTQARRMAVEAGIPIVPGTTDPLSDVKEAEEVVGDIGLPVLLKAAGGGGGKGVRIVRHASELRSSLEQATAEARAAFDNPDIYIERYLEKPRHIELQVLADHHGNVIHLGERECSVQRRFQKLIEESPSCALDQELRQTMGDAAIRAVKASEYVNAGTVEFLLDSTNHFYFCEVNARLQVEHPVTEMVTGLDIVKEQILIAQGHPLSVKQENVVIRGSAIECRVCAEDPVSFLPSTGTITEMEEPSGPGVRLESGVSEGYQVSLYYDPLISKLLTWGRDRDEAIARMRRALEEYRVKGILTTIPFHTKALDNQSFLSGNYDTGIVHEIEHPETDIHIEVAAIAAAIVAGEEMAIELGGASERSRWKMLGRVGNGLRRSKW